LVVAITTCTLTSTSARCRFQARTRNAPVRGCEPDGAAAGAASDQLDPLAAAVIEQRSGQDEEILVARAGVVEVAPRDPAPVPCVPATGRRWSQWDRMRPLIPDEVSSILRVTPRHVRRLAAGGLLHRVRLGARTTRYTLSPLID
jgi:hypothetical protein